MAAIANKTTVSGSCEPGYESVRAALIENLADDLGGSAAMTVDGVVVADVWGGHRDLARTAPWEADTISCVWSTTKMASALCVLMLVERGELDLEAPVAQYWPEFAAAGKEQVLVRHVMSHTAGLPEFAEPVDDALVFDWDACCALLAAQAASWTPGDGSGYHAETQGWLLGELVRRVTGTTIGSFFAANVNQPLGLDFHIGLDDSHFSRVAEMATLRAEPTVQGAGMRSLHLVNAPSWRRGEFPASGGHTNARSVALAMAPIANGGIGLSPEGEQVQLLSPSTIDRIFEVQAAGVDRSLGRPITFGIGFGLTDDATPLGTNDRTCWWAGWGGSMCVIDVENRMTVAYTMNQMRGSDDFRAARVVFAAHEAMALARARG